MQDTQKGWCASFVLNYTVSQFELAWTDLCPICVAEPHPHHDHFVIWFNYFNIEGGGILLLRNVISRPMKL